MGATQAPGPSRSAAVDARLHAARCVTLGFAAGAVTGVASVAGLVVREAVPGRPPVAATLAAALFAAAPALHRLARWSAGARGGSLLGLTLLGPATFSLLGALWALGEPLVSSHWRCGTNAVAAAILGPVFACGFGVAGSLLAGGALAVARARGGWLVRACAGAMALAAMALAGAAMVRAARFPAPDAWLATRPASDVLPEVEFTRAPYDAIPQHLRAPQSFVQRAAGLTFVRRCDDASGCRLHLVSESTVDVNSQVEPDSLPVESGAYRVTRDEARGLVVLRGARGAAGAFRAARDGWRIADVRVFDVARELGPPRGWLALALAGLAVAGALIASRRRALAPLAARARWRAGVLGDDGWIAFTDGTPPVHAGAAAGVPVGPVVVLPASAPRPATFREAGGVGEHVVLAGTPAELERVVRDVADGRYALAFGALALTSAPLLAAAMRGLVI